MTSLAATVADWSEVFRLATFQGGLNATTVTVGTLLLGIAAGVVGVFALLRRRSLVADALSHATLPGLVIAFVAAVALGGDGRSLPVLLAGATDGARNHARLVRRANLASPPAPVRDVSPEEGGGRGDQRNR